MCGDVEVGQDTWLSLALVPLPGWWPFLIRGRSVNPGTSQIPDLLSAEPFLSALTIL